MQVCYRIASTDVFFTYEHIGNGALSSPFCQSRLNLATITCIIITAMNNALVSSLMVTQTYTWIKNLKQILRENREKIRVMDSWAEPIQGPNIEPKLKSPEKAEKHSWVGSWICKGQEKNQNFFGQHRKIRTCSKNKFPTMWSRTEPKLVVQTIT